MSIRPPLLDPCADPANASSEYCRTRAYDADGYPESPAEWNARLGALEVPVTRGTLTAGVGWIVGAVLALLALADLSKSRR